MTERERNKPGKIRGFFEPGHTSRDSINDTLTLSCTIHDDMIDRGFKMETGEVDESGHFLTIKFVKRDDYVP